MKTISIFGVTGSIGRSAAKVILAQPDMFDVRCITAHNNAKLLAEMAVALGAKHVVLSSEENFSVLQACLVGTDITCACGETALLEAACMPVDVTLAAIVGMAGLRPLMHAIEHSAVVAIANKEPLVAAGDIVLAHARTHGTKILPVDSEHNAIFQVLDAGNIRAVKRIILTASGGPFRTASTEEMKNVTPQQAVQHPNWSMGAKISVDSATMMNKALEVIEAHYLFSIPADKIDVVVHPQSVVHSMVEYCDGSVLTQMGASDMCTPLANVLAWPERLQTAGDVLDILHMPALCFEDVRHDVFPAVRLAYRALEMAGGAPLAMNAANEVAVQAFLEGRIGFTDIVNCVEFVLDGIKPQDLPCLEDVISYDQQIRVMAESYISELTKQTYNNKQKVSFS